MKYAVIDRRTGKTMGIYSTRRRASRKVDKLDNEYGGYRYIYKQVEA